LLLPEKENTKGCSSGHISEGPKLKEKNQSQKVEKRKFKGTKRRVERFTKREKKLRPT